MALGVVALMCPFTIASDIFTLKKNIVEMHYNNAKLNVPDNAHVAVFRIAMARHWLVMGLKTNSSPVDARLSKMEAAIENITFFPVVGNLEVNQQMECEATAVVIAKVASMEELQWTTVMAKNMPGGQLGYGDPSWRAQTKGVQVQLVPHRLRGQGRWN